MAGYGKYLGALLGFLLGNIFGAFVGFVLGSIYDNASLPASQKRTNVNVGSYDFTTSLLILIACVMKANGRVDKSELAVVKKFLLTNFGEERALDALQTLKNILNQEINETEVALQIGQSFNYSTKLELIHLLFNIAYADGNVDEMELQTILRIANYVGISAADFNSLRAPYTRNVDAEWPYKALEIETTASTDEIKKAYRRMAMKYHPDKVHQLGEEIKKTATEKFRSINEAYEILKKQRGFN